MENSTVPSQETKTYGWRKQYEIGTIYEKKFDAHLSSLGYTLHPASRNLQRAGVDRWARASNGFWFTVEYKADLLGAKTGRIFLETDIKTETENKLGWVMYSVAQILLVTTGKNCLWANMFAVKSAIPWLVDRQGYTRWVENEEDGERWQARGVVVPIKEFKREFVTREDEQCFS